MPALAQSVVPRVPLRWALWASAAGWVIVALALIVSTSLLARATERVAHDFRTRIAVAELKSELLVYGHVGELARAGWTSQLERLRGGAEARLEALLGELGERAKPGAEGELVLEVERRVEALAATTGAVRRADPDDGATRVRREEELAGALAKVEALERLEDAAVQDARRHAAVVNRVSNAIGGVALLMVALAPVGVLAVRRWVTVPLYGIMEAIRQLRLGAHAPRAPEQAPTELSHLARAFNETADVLAAQRRAQLAFVAGVAHDLRTPLSALRTAAAVLGKTFDARGDERARRSLDVIVRQTGRLARMVDDLLDASRIESGELRLARERVDAREVARRCVEMFADVSSLHEVTLAGPDAPALVEADPGRLEQVLVNLLENAIKYSPAGGPVVVDVRTHGDEVLAEVRDRGAGIPPALLGHLFEPFRRGDQPHAEVPGAGLGLSIVRRIVTAHGGHVEVDSVPEAGTTFRVRLPRAGAPPLLPRPGARRAPGPDGAAV